MLIKSSGTHRDIRSACCSTVDADMLGAASDKHHTLRCAQGIGKLESEMQQLRGNLANFATTMTSLRGVASAAPSQCAPPTRKSGTPLCSLVPGCQPRRREGDGGVTSSVCTGSASPVLSNSPVPRHDRKPTLVAAPQSIHPCAGAAMF